MANRRLGERGVAARQQLQLLFPPPLIVERKSNGQTREIASWVGVPSAGNPRLLVGVTAPQGAARVIRRQMSGRRPRTAAARLVFGALAGAGLLTSWRGLRWTVSGPEESDNLARELSGVLRADDLRLTLAIGPARANRKPVIQVTGGDAATLAFVKVGHNPLTRALVDREAGALPRLTATLTDVEIPRLMAVFDWQSCRVLVQSPLDIPVRRLPETQHEARLMSVVKEIAAIGGLVSVSWKAHPLRARLRTELSSLLMSDEDVSTRLGRILDQVPLNLMVLTGSWHGDLNDGNLALTRERSLVWDWERFEDGVPVGFDLLHHRLHRDITVRHVAPHDAAENLRRRGPQLLQEVGVDSHSAHWVTKLYLATLAARYAGDDQTGAGAALGQVQRWLLPAAEN